MEHHKEAAYQMTDFLTWWADHWPIIPVLVWLFVWYNLQFHWLAGMIKRKGGGE